jgi:hypothetical protein
MFCSTWIREHFFFSIIETKCWVVKIGVFRV